MLIEIFLIFLFIFVIIAILIIIGPPVSKDVLDTGNNALGSYIAFIIGYVGLSLTPKEKKVVTLKYGPKFEGYTNDSGLIKF